MEAYAAFSMCFYLPLNCDGVALASFAVTLPLFNPAQRPFRPAEASFVGRHLPDPTSAFSGPMLTIFYQIHLGLACASRPAEASQHSTSGEL